MKNKTIDMFLVFFVILLLVSYYTVKETVWDDEEYFNKFDQVEEYAKNGDWKSAKSLATDMKETWHDHNFIIMLNYAEAEFALFEETLNHIIAGTEAEELAEVLTYTENAQVFWKNFNKMVPEP